LNECKSGKIRDLLQRLVCASRTLLDLPVDAQMPSKAKFQLLEYGFGRIKLGRAPAKPYLNASRAAYAK